MAILISGTCEYYFTWPKGVGIALHFPDGTQAQYKVPFKREGPRQARLQRVSNRSHDDGGRDRWSCFGDREEPGSRNPEKYKDKNSLRGSRTVREEICC